MKRKPADVNALTDEEIAFLRSERAADPIRKFVARQHEGVGVRTSAYRKVAAAARAEYEALVAVAHVNLARERAGVIDVSGSEQHEASRNVELANENRELRKALDEVREAALRNQASGALAVSSSD